MQHYLLHVERAPDTGTPPNYVIYIKTTLSRGQRVGRVLCSVFSRTPEDIEGKFWKRPTLFLSSYIWLRQPPPLHQPLSQHLPHLSLSLYFLFVTCTDCIVKLTRERVKPKKTTAKKCGSLPMDSLHTLLYNQSSGCKFPHQLCSSSVLCCTVFYYMYCSTVQTCCTVLNCNARNALYCPLRHYGAVLCSTALHFTALFCTALLRHVQYFNVMYCTL